MSNLLRQTWGSTKCVPWLVILIILYAVPYVFDLAPDMDTYIAGVPFLGLYGTIILTLIGLIVSIIYGMSCVHESVVMRCGIFGCNEQDEDLMFPPNFPEHEKLRYKAAMKGVPRGFTTLHPWSEYNRKLQALNESLYDPNFETEDMPPEYYTKLKEIENIKQTRLDEYVMSVRKTGIEHI